MYLAAATLLFGMILLWPSIHAQGNFSNIVGWPADTTTLSATAPSAPTSNAAATTNGVDNCSQCSIYAPSVTIYYFPSGSQVTNTACLTGALAVHTDPPPAGYENFQPQSVYLVIPAISAGNSCSQRGKVFVDQTLPFASEGLSTIEKPSGSTLAFNFQDLPCPPPDVASNDWWFYNPSYNPTMPYRPLLSAPPEIWELDPSWSDCVTATNNFLDPPIAVMTTQGGFEGSSGGFRPPRRHRRARHAHAVPHGPMRTPGPVPK